MFEAIIAFSLRQRGAVLLATLALLLAGIFAFSRLPIDAVPDITNNQVQILTSSPAMSPLEIEQFVTFPIEVALKSLPDLVELRSVSKAGLSVVTVVFEDDVDTYFARQQVLEKLREAEERMPPGAGRPELAPVSTGLGEIFRYVVRDTTGRLTPMDLRTIQDWIVRRQLLGTTGLAEVNSLGGELKQYQVLIDPAALSGYDLTLREVFESVARSGGNAGGAYIESGPEQYSVRSVALATSLDDIRNTVVRATTAGTPITVGDIATVEIGPALRFGSASQDGKGEVVTGITMQLKGANARVIVDAVKQRIESIKPSLPPGVVIEPYYDREELVDRTISTVASNLAEGALLVVAVLLIFLANVRAGFILASVIPLSMMFAAILMVLTGQSGNLMSLGAIDFGLLVDGSLIIVESCLRLFARRLNVANAPPMTRSEMTNTIYAGAVEVIKAAKFGVFIIIIVYLPIMTLQGVEGKFFRPMALTVTFALIGALILSITYVPVMCALFLKRTGRVRESPIILFLHRHYKPALARVLEHRYPIVGSTLVLLAIALFAFTRMGGEFIPRLDEGDIALQIFRLPSISLTESQKIATRVEKAMMRFPEVKTIVSHTGRAEISTDPMGVEISDVFIILRPRDEWTTGRTKSTLVAAMSEELEKIPGVGGQFLQPIEMRMNELIAGVRGDVAVKIFGESFEVLNPAAQKIAGIVSSTSGAADIAVEQTTGLPQLIIRPNRPALARHGLSTDDVNAIVATAIGGEKAGEVFEGEKRFDIVVRYGPAARANIDVIRALLVSAPDGSRIPLSSIASIELEEGPAQVSRENGSRYITVQANVRDRDVESFVKEVQNKIRTDITLPPGYNIEYGGQFENLRDASARLAIVVPVSLLLIFLLLFQTFRSLRLGLMIFFCVPMAVIGGVAALLIAGLPFSISAGVGFIALFGIAVLNGIVMVAAIRKYQQEGLPIRDAVLTGADERLRPVITTAVLAGLGFLPMMLANGAGAEVQRPLATVVIGGLISSTLLTLFVLPIILDWFAGSIPASEAHEEDADEIMLSDKLPDRSSGGIATTVILIVIALFALSSGAVNAQTRLTLEIVRERAIAAAPQLAGSQAAIERQRALRGATWLLPDPEVFGTVDGSPSASLTGGASTSIGVSQSFEFPTVYSARARVADNLIAQATAEAEVMRRAIVLRSTLAYVDVLAAQARSDIADTTVALAKRFAGIARLRHDIGEINALELSQASLALAGAQQRQTVAHAILNTRLAQLRILIGAPSTESYVIPTDRLFEPVRAATLDLYSAAEVFAPQIESARHGVEAARAQEALTGAEKLPGFALEYSSQTIDGIGGSYGGQLRVGVPLFRWLSDAPDRAAQAETAIRQAELASAERELGASMAALINSFESTRSNVSGYTDRLIPSATEGYRLAMRFYEEGDASYLEVLAAQSTLIEIRTGFIEALIELETLRIELETVTGVALR